MYVVYLYVCILALQRSKTLLLNSNTENTQGVLGQLLHIRIYDELLPGSSLFNLSNCNSVKGDYKK